MTTTPESIAPSAHLPAVGFETLETSLEIDKLVPAVVSVQQDLVAVTKDAQNPQYRSKYATLTACLDVAIPALTAHGFALVQAGGIGPTGAVLVSTTLMHVSGQWMRTTLPMRPTERGDSNQALGSAISYGRRYGISLLLSLRQNDDDGNIADGIVETPVSRKVSPDDQKKSDEDIRGSERVQKGLSLLFREFGKLSDAETTQLLKPAATVNEACRLIQAARKEARMNVPARPSNKQQTKKRLKGQQNAPIQEGRIFVE
jgi:hypothetical protein